MRRRRLYLACNAPASPSRVVAAFPCCHRLSLFKISFLSLVAGSEASGSICNDVPPVHHQQLHGGRVAHPCSSPASEFALSSPSGVRAEQIPNQPPGLEKGDLLATNQLRA